MAVPDHDASPQGHVKAQKSAKKLRIISRYFAVMFIRKLSSLSDGQVIKNRYHLIIRSISFKR
jgi:hypothetical protein